MPGERHRSRLRRAGYGFLGGFALASVAAVVIGLPQVEDSRTAAVRAELDQAGWAGIVVDFDGRDARISGTAPVGVSLMEVELLVAAVPGVRDVTGTVTVAATRPPPGQAQGEESPVPPVVAPEPRPEQRPDQNRSEMTRLILTSDGGLLVLRGTADEMLAALLGDEAGSVFGIDNVENRIESNEGSALPDEWLEMVTTTIALLQDYDGVTLRVNEDHLEYQGRISDDAAAETLTRRLSEIANGVVDVSGSFDVIVGTAPNLVLDVTDGVATLSGHVASDETIAELSAQLERVFDAVRTELAVGAAREPWVTRVPFDYLPRGGTYTLAMTGEEAELTGSVVSEDAQTRFVSALRRAGFDVIDQLAATAELAEGVCTPETLNADLSSDVLFGREGVTVANNSRAQAAVADLAVRVGACEGTMLTLLVFTDDRTSHDDAHEFTHERAGALLEALTTFGIDEDTIAIIGMGADRPIADNSTNEGRALNRRVEFQVMTGGD